MECLYRMFEAANSQKRSALLLLQCWRLITFKLFFFFSCPWCLMSTCFSPKEGKRTGAVTFLWSCSARAVYSWVAAEWLKWPGLLSELTVKFTWWLLVLSGGRMALLRSSGLGKEPRVCSWWEVTYSVLWFSTEKINRCVQMLSCTMTLKAPNRGHFPCKLLWSHSFPNEENQWMIAGYWKWMVVIRMLSLLWGRAEKGRELVVTQAVVRSAETEQAALAGWISPLNPRS